MATKQKVEARSRTGAQYNRAGERWGSAWRDVPAELVKDDARMKALAADPHIEIRVDGEYVSGPRKGTRQGEAVHPAPSADGPAAGDMAAALRHIENLENALDEFRGQHEELRGDHDKIRAQHVENERKLGSFQGELAKVVGLPLTASKDDVLDALSRRVNPKPISAALGLREDATEADILAQIGKLSAPAATPTTPSETAKPKKA